MQRDGSSQNFVSARIRQQRSRTGRAAFGQPSFGAGSSRPFVHPNDTQGQGQGQASVTGLSLHEIRLAEKAATYERALQRSISASLARKRAGGVGVGVGPVNNAEGSIVSPLVEERPSSARDGLGGGGASSDHEYDVAGEIESELGDSYVHGVRTRGPREEDYLEEGDELDGGGVMGLLTQIYSNQRRAIG